MSAPLKASYIAALHVLVVAAVAFPDRVAGLASRLGLAPERPEITDHHLRMVDHHMYMDGSVPPGAVLLFGDSLTQGLYPGSVDPRAVNYGIGGDTTAGALRRLPGYRSVDRAGVVVIAFGINDLALRDDRQIAANVREIVARVPVTVPVVLSAVLPIDDAHQPRGSARTQARVVRLNARLEAVADACDRIVHVGTWDELLDDGGRLADRFHVGDGIHLSTAGYAVWASDLRAAVAGAAGRP